MLTPYEKLVRQERLLHREIAIREAREDFLRYLQVMGEDPAMPEDYTRSTYTDEPVHRFLADLFQKIEHGDYDGRIVLISTPPRVGKSHIAKHFVAWVAGRHPEDHAIYATYNNDFAKDIGSEVREILKSPRHREVFPKFGLRHGSASSAFMRTHARGELKFAGEGGSITGKGGHRLLADDMFKNDEEAASPTARDSKWNWFNRTFMTRVMNDRAPIIFIMTRWHDDDIVGRIIDPHNPQYNPDTAARVKVINLPAIAEHDDPLGRKPGEVIWPERFSREFLDQRRRQDPVGFEALYQGRPTAQDGDIFKRDYIRYYRPANLPKNLRIYASSDHAVSEKQKRDYTVLLVVGVDEMDDIYLLDCWWDRADPLTVTEEMLRMMRQWKPIVWWAERGHISASIGPFLRKRMFEERVYVTIDDPVPVADKVSRAQSVSGRMSMGKVWFPQFAPWATRAVDELMKFPNGTHNDFVDALSWIGLELDRLFGSRLIRKAKKDPSFGTGSWLQGLIKDEMRDEARRKAAGGF